MKKHNFQRQTETHTKTVSGGLNMLQEGKGNYEGNCCVCLCLHLFLCLYEKVLFAINVCMCEGSPRKCVALWGKKKGKHKINKYL